MKFKTKLVVALLMILIVFAFSGCATQYEPPPKIVDQPIVDQPQPPQGSEATSQPPASEAPQAEDEIYQDNLDGAFNEIDQAY